MIATNKKAEELKKKTNQVYERAKRANDRAYEKMEIRGPKRNQALAEARQCHQEIRAALLEANDLYEEAKKFSLEIKRRDFKVYMQRAEVSLTDVTEASVLSIRDKLNNMLAMLYVPDS